MDKQAGKSYRLCRLNSVIYFSSIVGTSTKSVYMGLERQEDKGRSTNDGLDLVEPVNDFNHFQRRRVLARLRALVLEVRLEAVGFVDKQEVGTH